MIMKMFGCVRVWIQTWVLTVSLINISVLEMIMLENVDPDIATIVTSVAPCIIFVTLVPQRHTIPQ